MEVTSATTPTTPSARSKIGSDFDTFLKMFTVQLQNQDPLNPTDPSDYAVQLATFSAVEQQVMTNDLLTGLSDLMASASLADFAGMVGKEVLAPTTVTYTNTPITVEIPPAAGGADSADLVVRDENGFEVQRMPVSVAGSTINWSGEAQGTHSFALESYEGDTLTATTTASVYARVVEVRSDASGPVLVFESGGTAPAASISGLRG
ncbi:flagellar basal body rod modification protein [Marivivens donghaensis]|uniref:Basal-body rod modification protein FlgD n=1 Tax=Marivivens donghaensis TaxID=1699413 RepID=A0ABX0VZU6_9RHOB|nr:flagellar hook capping FlgD N-terminal domain-containing protein [Marivivens donghaensis]NIY73290.1 flagellar basal body rod modification protein [Marivivens donghaensis]